MAVLRALKGLNPGQIFPLEGDRIVLGRHPDCDIVLEIGAVSRQHARILCSEGAYYVEDLHSRNGTFVNGSLIQDRQRLRENDQVKICDLVFVFHHGAPTSDPTVTDFGTMQETSALLVDDEHPGSGSQIMSQVDVSSTELRIAANAEAKLKALLEIARNLGNVLGLNEVLQKLLESLFKIFLQADRGFVVLKDPQTGKLIPRAVKHRRGEEGETVRISRTICSNVMASKKAILSADAASDSRFDMAESIVDFQIRSMMCAPLVGVGGDVVGVIQVDTVDARKRFQQEDLEVLASVACQAAVAVENARLHESALRDQALRRELALAHEVQQGFLPGTSPNLDGYEFFDFYEAANHVGGDYYDYIRLPDRQLALVVADVAGKGIAAALLMAKLSAETRYCLVSEPTPAEAINCLNTILIHSGFEDRFVTLVLTVLDPVEHEVTIVNAGHMAPLLRASDASVRSVAEDVTNLPLGIDSGVDYSQAVLRLEPGDWLTLYTDGVTDAMNVAGELYGPDRLRRLLEDPSETVSEMGRRLLDDVRRFVGPRAQSDDMCFTCFGRLPGKPTAKAAREPAMQRAER